MALFENQHVRISLDTNTPCLEWIGKGFMSSALFRESEEKSLEFYLEYKKQYPKLEWYVDARNIGPLPSKDTQWVTDEILPKFAAAGLTKEAFVVPDTILGQVTVKNYVSKAGQTIEIQMFDTVNGAKDWLKR